MGASKGSAASFPVGDVVSASSPAITGMSLNLGEVIGPDKLGREYRLVRLNDGSGVASPAKTVFKWSAIATNDVATATAATDLIAGVAVPGQAALADNDLFWLQINGPVICTDSGSGVSAGDLLTPTTGGEVLTGTAATNNADFNAGKDVLSAVASASADADVYADFIRRCIGYADGTV